MSKEFKLPLVSEGTENATVTKIMVQVGDTITDEQSVMEIETDKATLEVPAGIAGKVEKILIAEGEEISVEQTLMVIAEAEDQKAATSPPPTPIEKETAEAVSEETTTEVVAEESDVDTTLGGEGLKAQLVVIGAGPGGYEAALHAASHGVETVLIHKEEKMGGVCLHRGCIPSKTLLNVGHLLHSASEADQMGISFSKPEIDINKLRDFKLDVVSKLSNGIGSLCKSHKVRHIHAHAAFIDSHTVRLTYDGDKPENEPDTISFDNAMIATGSVPVFPKVFDLQDPRVMDSTGALELAEIPETFLVVGGGYIGLELGSVYAALGSKVTVVELMDQLLTGADRDLVRPLEKRLDGLIDAIRLSTRVESLKATDSGIEATLSKDGKETTETFDRVLISMGRRPVTDGLGLENTQVQVNDRGFIVVDEQLRTADSHLFAIGDVAGDPMLAHKATREGKVAAEVIAGGKTVYDNIACPAVVFTDPEIAWCGLTELEAKEQGIAYEVGRFSWAGSGRATALNCTNGLTKLLFEPETERVLGVGIVGQGAGDLISEGVVAVEMAAVARDVADSIHPHPTLSETLSEAAGAYLRKKHKV